MNNKHIMPYVKELKSHIIEHTYTPTQLFSYNVFSDKYKITTGKLKANKNIIYFDNNNKLYELGCSNFVDLSDDENKVVAEMFVNTYCVDTLQNDFCKFYTLL